MAENEYADSSTGVVVLKSNGRIASPTGGVALTGIGYIDGKLHVQVYYEDILKTDNHGFIKLINKNTGENIDCYGSVSFFDEEQRGSYTDYVFTNIPLDTENLLLLLGALMEIGALLSLCILWTTDNNTGVDKEASISYDKRKPSR